MSKKLLDSSGNPLVRTTDFEGQLQELCDEVKTMITMGNENDAIDLLQPNYEAVEEQMDSGARGIGQAATLDVIALGYIAIGDLKMVGSLLDMDLWTIFRVDTVQAVVVLVRAILNIFFNVHKGADSEDLVVPLLGLDNLLMKKGKAKDTENPFIGILNVYTKLCGENAGRVGMAMCSLAHVKCGKGNAYETIQLYRNALQVLKDSKCMPLDDNVMEKMRIDLAELLLHLVGSFVEAKRLLRRSLQIMLKTVGPDDQSITFSMLHLAITLHDLNQYAEAEQVALEVLCISEKAFGKESLPVSEAVDCLVSIQTKLGKDNIELLELLKRVLAIQEKAFGYESKEVIQTLNKIVFYLDKMGMRDDKFPMQRRLSMLRTKYKHMVQY
ncbi:unnamed protein product [Camellia sinensis]